MIKIQQLTNKLTELPRPNRREVERIIKDIYYQGKEDGEKIVYKNKNITYKNGYKIGYGAGFKKGVGLQIHTKKL